MARLPLVSDATDSDLLRELFERIRSRGLDVPNLYLTIAHAPRMLQAWMDFTWPLRFNAVSPRSLRELLIMRVAQRTDAIYEWSHHWQMALANEVSLEQLLELRQWEQSGAFSDEERVALRYTDAIVDMRVDDDIFENVRQTFSPEVIIELTLTASFYTNLARVAQALQLDLEPKYEEYAKQIHN
jgi:alkylhydroperoxidase family enzyme